MLEMALAINAHFVESTPKLGKALIEPHVARFFTGHQVTRPHVRQLVGHILLACGGAIEDAGGKSDVVGMLHAALACADIADAVERISPKILFKERNDFLDMHECAWNVVHLRRLGIDLNRDVALDTMVDILPKLVVADGKRNMVSGNLLRGVPMPSGGAVTVVKGLHMVAATDGLHVVGHSDINIVGSLVGKIVDTGEPGLTQVVRLTLEAHAEVIDIVAIGPPFHTAPILTEGRAAIAHIEDDIFASRYGLVKNDRQKITFLVETLHAVQIASHIGSDKAHQFQHNGICGAGNSKVNKRLPLHRVAGEFEIPNMDFVMRHVDVFAWHLGFQCKG